MKSTEIENNGALSHTAGAEKDLGEMNAYGKFKDARSLLKAYESLESEFTRRSQKLKAIEGELLSRSEKDKAGQRTAVTATAEDLIGRYPKAERYAEKLKAELSANAESNGGAEEAYIKILEGSLSELESKLAEKVEAKPLTVGLDLSELAVKTYLKRIMDGKSPAKAVRGVALTVPPKRPHSIAEASAIAKNYIKRRS